MRPLTGLFLSVIPILAGGAAIFSIVYFMYLPIKREYIGLSYGDCHIVDLLAKKGYCSYTPIGPAGPVSDPYECWHPYIAIVAENYTNTLLLLAGSGYTTQNQAQGYLYLNYWVGEDAGKCYYRPSTGEIVQPDDTAGAVFFLGLAIFITTAGLFFFSYILVNRKKLEEENRTGNSAYVFGF